VSLRVHKFLGYGLTDLDHDGDGRITDRRVSRKSWLLADEDAGNAPEPADYLTWLTQRQVTGKVTFSVDLAALKGTCPVPASRRLGGCCMTGEPGGLPGVLVLQPYAMDQWARQDDDIDWITESWQLPFSGIRVPAPRGQESHLAVLTDGPHPFNGFFMDARTGDPVSEAIRWWLQFFRATPGYPGARAADAENREILDHLAQAAGLAGHAEAAAVVVPRVPREIRDLAEYGELFPDPGTWRELRPVLLTTWR
jgi:hypothetical protein